MSPVKKTKSDRASPLSPSSPQQFQDIINYFPIGEQVDYYPEYQTNLTMQSIILGYEINGHVIFSRNQVEFLTGKNDAWLICVYINEKRYEYTHITSFCIVLPGKAGEEYKLNYLNKASLGPRGQFRTGNSITMMARHQNRGIIHLETTVRESILQKSGYYRNHQLALLEATATSLDISEQRNHHRINTKIPITLSIRDNPQTYNCLMTDYSEVGSQISFNQEDKLAHELKPGDHFKLTLQLDKLHKTFVIGGVILRKQEGAAILTFQDIISEGNQKSFELIDALYIKSCLLQHPQTD